MKKYQDILAVEIEDVNWIQLAHERIQQLAVVRMVMELLISYDVIIFD
jgi:hypothetical protein